MKKVLTLCMVCKGDQILLGMKKRGFGAGRWNGFGGKVEEGETIQDAAIRELSEEAGIQALTLDEIGLITFSFDSDPKILEVHIFKVNTFTGEPMESDEMMPKWLDVQNIPFDMMWSSDRYWFPYMLKNKKFQGEFHFDMPSTAEYASKIISYKLNEVGEI